MSLRGVYTGAERFLERFLGAYDNAPPCTTDEALLALSERFKLQIITDYAAVEENFSFEQLDKSQYQNAAELLTTELGLYSPETIHASKLERVVLCSNLRGGEETVSGLADVGFLVVDTILINIDRASKVWEHARRTVHHELFHCMDYHDDGYLDFNWRRLNSPDFTYWHMNNLQVVESHQAGFLQDYCKKSEWEDKAVVYSYMMVNYAELLDRCQTDKILDKKVEAMKEIVRKISSEFDDAFWERIHERSLPHAPHVYSPNNNQPVLLDSLVGELERVTITFERSAGRPTWLVNIEALDASSQRFYSYNKLANFLRKTGVPQVPSKEDLADGTYTISLK